MRTLLTSLLIVLALGTPKAIEITIKNPTNEQRLNETIELSWVKIAKKIGLSAKDKLIVVDSEGIEYPSQIVFEGKKTPQKFIFQISLLPYQTRALSIIKGVPQLYESKTYGRFVPERKDDYAWENDRVAFRMYGPALIKTDGPSNGIDIWCKRTEKPIINLRYEKELSGNGSYHTDWGDGLDCYKVGRTLGAGAMAPYINDSLYLGSNFENQETLDNGPIRTTFRLTYGAFNVNGQQIKEIRTISLDAGSQFNKIEEEYIGLPDQSNVAAGIVKRNGKDSTFVDAKRRYAIYIEPATENDGKLCLAVICPKRWISVKSVQSHTLAIANYHRKQKMTYYAGFGWSKWGFPTSKSWIDYTNKFATNLKNKLIVKIK